MENCYFITTSKLKESFILTNIFFVLLISVAGGLRDVELILPLAVYPGSNATLLCKYNLEGDPLYSVKWYKGRHEFYRFVPKEFPHSSVFPLPGVDVDISQSGADKVTLRDIQPELSGRFRCEVSSDLPDFHTMIVSATMTVIAAEERKPVIKLEKTTYSVGDVLRGNCTSPPSLPPSNISWFINYNKMNNSFVEQTKNHSRIVTTAGLELHVDTFFSGRMRLRCVANIHNLKLGEDEVWLTEEQPRLASVLGTRDSAKGDSITLWRLSAELILTSLAVNSVIR